jgi:hypothetical protein
MTMAKWDITKAKCTNCEELEDALEYWRPDSAAGWDKCEEHRIARDVLAVENERLRGNVQTLIHAFFAAREGELSAAMHQRVAEVIAANPPPSRN